MTFTPRSWALTYTHTLMLVNTQSIEMHKNLKLDTNKAIRQIALTCSFMQQCCAFMQLIMRQNFHFVATGPAAVRGYELSTKHESLQVNTINHLCGVEYIAPNPHFLGVTSRTRRISLRYSALGTGFCVALLLDPPRH